MSYDGERWEFPGWVPTLVCWGVYVLALVLLALSNR
jgi:hypothetical protein